MHQFPILQSGLTSETDMLYHQQMKESIKSLSEFELNYIAIHFCIQRFLKWRNSLVDGQIELGADNLAPHLFDDLSDFIERMVDFSVGLYSMDPDDVDVEEIVETIYYTDFIAYQNKIKNHIPKQSDMFEGE
ncbi:MAG: hypothetical protein EO766_12190 [Hydrotalea sp. AMD]|uniref:hypothetical protein n=1 Tax=Hydrotalea sp. AMD TaxID=2501297 RepID=UPI00102810B4|nr:hypothetical protein [Hydrotalea sp. AMD]RWZ87277.1 MAG: hypothetical protein EO766_12190 [Hydrotalea sp. AMD]